MSRPDPILVIRLSSLGDVVQATAVLDPRGRRKVGFLTREQYAPLLAGHPGIGKLLIYRRGAWRRLLKEVAAGRYRAVLDLQGNLRSYLLGRAAGCRVARVKKDSLRRRLGVLCHPLLAAVPHRVDAFLAAARELKLRVGGLPRLFPQRQDCAQYKRRGGIAGGKRFIAVAPGSLWPTKRWPAESFAQLIKLLARRGYGFILVGSEAERELCARIAARAGATAVSLAGRTAGGRLAAVLSLCRLLITNDSGPMHVAAAVGTPVVAIFGSTVSRLGFAPRGARSRIVEREMWCRPCHVHGRRFCPLGHLNCLRRIGAEEVAAAAVEMLGE